MTKSMQDKIDLIKIKLIDPNQIKDFLSFCFLDRTWSAMTTRRDMYRGFWVILTDSLSGATCGTQAPPIGSASKTINIQNME